MHCGIIYFSKGDCRLCCCWLERTGIIQQSGVTFAILLLNPECFHSFRQLKAVSTNFSYLLFKFIWFSSWVGKLFRQKATFSTCVPLKAAVKVSLPKSMLYVVITQINLNGENRGVVKSAATVERMEPGSESRPLLKWQMIEIRN